MKNSEYKQEIDKALNDDFLRKILDSFAISYKENRQGIFADTDLEQVVAELIQSKTKSLNNRHELYAKFKAQAEKKGAQVLFARTAAEANALIKDIAREHRAKSIVKSKSMTSEEIRLNHYLADNGINAQETDLGEWICQLRGETPSHMVLPSIHLSRQQVAQTFDKKVENVQDENDITALVRLARRNLRQSFVSTNLGLTGANFCIAESGTVGIATNEGNARLISTLPENHIVLCGLDKIVATLEDALNILELLPKNATAQHMTSFVSMFSGANKSPSCDKRLYIIVLDNGRSEILADPLFAETLNCIRCGACANVCPVFRLVGGHRMGYIYVGAIGLILTYFFHGEEAAKVLVQNCINCGACKEVCSAGIDLPALIEELRLRTSKDNLPSGLMSKVIKNRKLFHSLLKFAKFAQKPVARGEYIRHLPSIFDKSLGFRTLPSLAEQSFRELYPSLVRKIENPKLKVAIFGGCLQDFVYPEDLQNCLNLLYAHNIQVDFPLEQNCCGLPVLMLGQKGLAKEIAEQNIQAFSPSSAEEYDYIICLCASCASHLALTYPKLVGENPLSAKMIDYSSFVVDVLGLENIAESKNKPKVAYHVSCHFSKKLKAVDKAKAIIAKRAEYQASQEEDLCCGFGGTYTVKFPSISANLLQRKLEHLQKSKAELLVTDCPGCVLQLKGAMEKNKINMRVCHISALLQKDI